LGAKRRAELCELFAGRDTSSGLQESTARKPLPAPAYTWFTASLCLLAYILSFADRQIIALLVVPIRVDLKILDG
jgi:hypothetical protein